MIYDYVGLHSALQYKQQDQKMLCYKRDALLVEK